MSKLYKDNKWLSQKNCAIFSLLFGALSWGVIWYPYRLLSEAGFSGVATSFYTYVITVVIGLILFAKHWRELQTLPKNIIWLCMVAGWTNLSYVLAVIDGEVMRVMLLFYLSPLWTLLLAHFWLKENINKSGFLAIIVSLLGAAIMLYNPATPYSLPIPQNTAEWLALSSGIGFSLTNVITRKSTELSIQAKSFAVWFGVIAMAIIFLPFVGQTLPAPGAFNAHQWLMMGLIALMLLAATLLVQYGVSHILASRAAVIFLFELVIAAVASYYLANEIMQIQEWIGGALIVLAALFTAKTQD